MTRIFFFWLPWQPDSCMDCKFLNNFQSLSPKDQSGGIWLKLAQWFRGCCLKKWWTDRQMDDDDSE